MAVEVVTLIENSAGKHLQEGYTEHGLSFLVHVGEQTILFDTGASGKFLKNANLLEENILSSVHHVVLSHGHFDHTGGVPALLESTKNQLTFHVGPAFFLPKFAQDNGERTFLGNPFTKSELEAKGAVVYEQKEDVVELSSRIYLVTNFTRGYDLQWMNPRFVIPDNSGYVTDPFDDELAVVIESSKGLIVLVGCSHPGILNVIGTVWERFNENIFAVIGGIHLMDASGERLRQVVTSLAKMRDTFFGVSHCTGEAAVKELTAACPNFFLNNTGDRFLVGASAKT